MTSSKTGIRALWTILKETVGEFKTIDPLKEASSLAFTTIFAIPGVLIITLMVASAFYDGEAVREALYTQAGGFIGAETSKDLQGIVQKASTTDAGLFARILGIAALALSATAAFASLQNSLNKIWRVEPEPGRAILRYLLSRAISLGLIAAFGFLLLVSMVLDTALVAIAERVGKFLPGQAILAGLLGLVVSLGVVTLVFGLVFKFLPDVRVRWRSVWVGAFFTAVLFTMGKYLIALYIAKTGAGSVYGAGGAVIVIMLWVYYSSLILLFGAQYTFVSAREHGERIVPAPHAVRASER